MGVKYNNYLKSDWWKGLRLKRLEKNKKCETCGSKFNLQIHHFNYKFKYAGRASKAIKHTKVLCSTCHKAFHDTFGVKSDMTKEMKQFTKKVRKEKQIARKQWAEIYEQERWLKDL